MRNTGSPQRGQTLDIRYFRRCRSRPNAGDRTQRRSSSHQYQSPARFYVSENERGIVEIDPQARERAILYFCLRFWPRSLSTRRMRSPARVSPAAAIYRVKQLAESLRIVAKLYERAEPIELTCDCREWSTTCFRTPPTRSTSLSTRGIPMIKPAVIAAALGARVVVGVDSEI